MYQSFDTSPMRGSGLFLAGKGSRLHRKYGMYLDFVTIALVPEDDDQRLAEILLGAFKRLRLFALDPYDLALAKLVGRARRWITSSATEPTGLTRRARSSGSSDSSRTLLMSWRSARGRREMRSSFGDSRGTEDQPIYPKP